MTVVLPKPSWATEGGLDGSLGCPEKGMEPSEECFGIQPGGPIRLAVINGDGTTLVSWAGTSEPAASTKTGIGCRGRYRWIGLRRSPVAPPVSHGSGWQQPTAEDIAMVADEFGLPSLAVEDAVKAHQRPKLDLCEDVVFMVLKPVGYVDQEEVEDVSEVALSTHRRQRLLDTRRSS